MSDMDLPFDWADDIAVQLYDNQDGLDSNAYEIAAALRKAKADGMREAADLVEQIYGLNLAYSIRELADKLHPTE